MELSVQGNFNIRDTVSHIILQLTAHTELASFSITRSYGKNSFKVASSIDLKKALFMPDAAWWSVF